MKVDTSNKKVLAARVLFAVVSGLVVSTASFKWAATHGKGSDTFAEAVENAKPIYLVEASLLALIVMISNGCQYFAGIQDNTTDVKKRVSKYVDEHSGVQLAVQGTLTALFSIISGVALGGLYQQEFENDNQGIRLFIFAYMTLVGITFTRDLNYNVIKSAEKIVREPREAIENISLPKPSDALRLGTELVAFAAFYFVFGKSIEDVVKPLFGQKSDNSFSGMALWGMSTMFLANGFAQLTSRVWERVGAQIKNAREDFADNKIGRASLKSLYIVFANLLAFFSTASFFVSTTDDVNQGKYDALGWFGRNMQYFALLFGGLGNISAIAQVFDSVLFGIEDKSVASSSSSGSDVSSSLAGSASGSAVMGYGTAGTSAGDGYTRLENAVAIGETDSATSGSGLFDAPAPVVGQGGSIQGAPASKR